MPHWDTATKVFYAACVRPQQSRGVGSVASPVFSWRLQPTGGTGTKTRYACCSTRIVRCHRLDEICRIRSTATAVMPYLQHLTVPFFRSLLLRCLPCRCSAPRFLLGFDDGVDDGVDDDVDDGVGDHSRPRRKRAARRGRRRPLRWRPALLSSSGRQCTAPPSRCVISWCFFGYCFIEM